MSFIAMKGTPVSSGYWLLSAQDGDVYTFGSATYEGGSPSGFGGLIVDMAVTPTGKGTGWWAPAARSTPTATPRFTAAARQLFSRLSRSRVPTRQAIGCVTPQATSTPMEAPVIMVDRRQGTPAS